MAHPSQPVYPPGPTQNIPYQQPVSAQPRPSVGRVAVGRKPIGNAPPAVTSQGLHRQSTSSAASVWSASSVTSSQTSPSPTIASLHTGQTTTNAPVTTHYSRHCNLCKKDVTNDPSHLECLACTSTHASTLYCTQCCVDRGAIKNHHHHFSHFVSISDAIVHDPVIAAHGWEIRKSSLNVTWYHHKPSGTKTYDRPKVPVPAPQPQQTQQMQQTRQIHQTPQTHQTHQTHPTHPVHPVHQAHQVHQKNQQHQQHQPQKTHQTQTPQVNSNVPAAWEAIKDPDGRLFYYNRATKTSQWTRPALNPLPPGWTETMNPDGRTYYRHVASGTLTWNRPGTSNPNNQASTARSPTQISNPPLGNNGQRLSQSFSTSTMSKVRLPSVSGTTTNAMMQSTRNAAGTAGQGFKTAAQKFKNSNKAKKIAAGVGMSVVNSILRENIGISLGNSLVGLVGNDDSSGMDMGGGGGGDFDMSGDMGNGGDLDMSGDTGGFDTSGDMGGDGGFDMSGDMGGVGGFDTSGDMGSGGGFDTSGDMGSGGSFDMGGDMGGGGGFDTSGDMGSGGGFDMTGDMGGGSGTFDTSGGGSTGFDMSGDMGGGAGFDMSGDMGGGGGGFDMSGDTGSNGGLDMSGDTGSGGGGFDMSGDTGSDGGLDMSGDMGGGGGFDSSGNVGGGFDMSGNMIGDGGSFNGDAGSGGGGSFDMSGNIVDGNGGLDLSGDFSGDDNGSNGTDNMQDNGDQNLDSGPNSDQDSSSTGDPNADGDADQQYSDASDSGSDVDQASDSPGGQGQNQGVQPTNARHRPHHVGPFMKAHAPRPNATQQRVRPPATFGNSQGPRKQQMRPTATIPVPGKGSSQQRMSKPQTQNQQRPTQNQTTNLQTSTYSQKPMKQQIPSQSQPHSQQQPGQAHRPNPQQNRPQKPNQVLNRPQQQNQKQGNRRPQRPSYPQGATPPNMPANNPPRPHLNQLPSTQNPNPSPTKPRPLFSKPTPRQQQLISKAGKSIATSIIKHHSKPHNEPVNGGTNYDGYEYGEVDQMVASNNYDGDGYAQDYGEDGIDGNNMEDYQDDGDFDQNGNLDQGGNPLDDLEQLNIQDGEYNLSMEPDTYLEGGDDNGNYDADNQGPVDDTVNYGEAGLDQLNRGIGDFNPVDEVPKDNTNAIQEPKAALEQNTNSAAVPSENLWNESWFATTKKAPAADSTYQNLTSASVSGPMGFFDPFAPYDPGFDIEEDPSPTTTKAETAAQELMSNSIPDPDIAEVSGIPSVVGAVNGPAIMAQESEPAIVQQEPIFPMPASDLTTLPSQLNPVN